MMTTADDISAALFRATTVLRGAIPASSFREYVPALLFLKWCSDNLPGGEGAGQADVPALFEGWRVPRASHWRSLMESPLHVDAGLSRAFLALEAANPPLEGVFAALGLDRPLMPSAAPSWSHGLADAVHVLGELDLATHRLDPPDAAGLALEAYLQRWAGEWKSEMSTSVTPEGVVRLLVGLADPVPGMRVSDPTCGTGGFLIEAARHVAALQGRRLGLDRVDLVLHGQEILPGAWALARMLTVMRGLPHAELAQGNVLTQPFFVGGGWLARYDRIVTSPPFSLSNWGADAARYDRYGRFWRVPPRNVGDYAFVQHALATLDEGGVAALLLPPGALFRTGAEAELRQWLVESDVLDAVISLSANLLVGTGIPSIVMVLRRGRGNRGRRVLLVDASGEMTAQRPRNVLGPANVERIVDTYRRFDDVQGFARALHRDDLARNGFDLRPESYVAPVEVPAFPPLEELLADLYQAEAKRDALARRIDDYVEQLRDGF